MGWETREREMLPRALESLGDRAFEAYNAHRNNLAEASATAQAQSAAEVLELIRQVLGDPSVILVQDGATIRHDHFRFSSDISHEHGQALFAKWVCDRCGDYGSDVHIRTLTALGFVESQYRKHKPMCWPGKR